jgi:hypothetical protein
MNGEGAHSGEVLAEHPFPKLREREFAQRQPCAARFRTSPQPNDHKEVTMKTETINNTLTALKSFLVRETNPSTTQKTASMSPTTDAKSCGLKGVAVIKNNNPMAVSALRTSAVLSAALTLGITVLAIVATMGTTANAQTLTLTPAGINLGFTLSTFATLNPGFSGFGPFGVALAAPDRVLVYNVENDNTRYVFHDVDGQTRGSAITLTTMNGTGALAYATAGGLAYGGTSQFGQFAQYDTSGNVSKILTGVPEMTLRGMWGNPVNGHILATTLQETIIDINPSGTGSSRTVAGGPSFAWDGLTVSPDGKTVYGESGGSIFGFNIATGNQVFNSGFLAGGPDGMGVISSNNQLNGDLIVNFNGNGVNTGFVDLLDPNTLQLTVIASGGTRGDYASPDPTNGTLFLDYSDVVYRLSCGPNCSIGGGTTPEPGSLMLFGSGILGLAGVLRRRLMG